MGINERVFVRDMQGICLGIFKGCKIADLNGVFNQGFPMSIIKGIFKWVF